MLMHTAAGAGEPYELVVLDFQMAGMNGVDLARAIRRTPSLRLARLVMLTSTAKLGAGERGRRRTRSSTKPVRRAALLETVAGVAHPARAGRRARRGSRAAASGPRLRRRACWSPRTTPSTSW